VEVEPSDVDRPWCLRIVERTATPSDTSDDGAPRPPAPQPPNDYADTAGASSPPRSGSPDLDSPVNELLLISADSAAALLQWADAFEKAGVRVVWPVMVRELPRGASPGGSSFSGLSSRTNSAPLLREASAGQAVTGLGGAGAAEGAGSGAAPSPSGSFRRLHASGSLSQLVPQGQQRPTSLLRQLSSSLALPPLLTRRLALWGDAEAGSQPTTPPGQAAGGAAAPAGGLGSPNRLRQFSRLPSQRWVREPQREEFVAFLEPIASGGDDDGNDGGSGVVKRRSAGLGRSASASGIVFAASDASPFSNAGPSPLSRTVAAAAGGVTAATAASAPLHGTPPRPPKHPSHGADARTAAAATAAAAVASTAPISATPSMQAAAVHKPRVRRVMWGSTAVHCTTTDSLLTTRATYSQSHSGLVTLALVILATTHLRCVHACALGFGF